MNRQIHAYHEVIGYHYIPGLTARIPHEAGGYIIRTNEAGFRCKHEVTPRPPPGTFRVLLFGDSYTAGDGVSNQFRYGDLLEERFPRLQVLNFGLQGSATDQQYLVFKEFAEHLEYDLLMICPFVENIRRTASRHRPMMSRDGREGYRSKPYFDLVDGELILRNVPVPKGMIDAAKMTKEDLADVDRGPHFALRSFAETYLRPMKSLIRAFVRYQPLPAYNSLDDPDWLLMKAILSKWASESGDRPVVVCPIPMYHHIEGTSSPRQYQRRFKELEDLPQVTVFDPLPAFQSLPRADRRRTRFEYDIHFTEYGHQVLADALVPELERFMKAAAVQE